MGSFDIYQVINDKILSSLEKGEFGKWVKEWSAVKGAVEDGKFYKQANYNFFSKTGYSFVNNYMLSDARKKKGYESPFWLTFKQIKDLGGGIAGEHSAGMVVFYKMLDHVNKKEDKTNEGKEKKKSGEKEKISLVSKISFFLFFW